MHFRVRRAKGVRNGRYNRGPFRLCGPVVAGARGKGNSARTSEPIRHRATFARVGGKTGVNFSTTKMVTNGGCYEFLLVDLCCKVRRLGVIRNSPMVKSLKGIFHLDQFTPSKHFTPASRYVCTVRASGKSNVPNQPANLAVSFVLFAPD